MKTFIIIALIAVAIVGGILYVNAPENPQTAQLTPPPAAPVSIANTATIHMTDAGYEPKEITITSGTAVTFVNDGTKPNWPASAMHPTHTIYPNSDIQKCGTPEQASIFDACEGIAPGKSWTFTFNEIGEWRYHDHLQASRFGKITVVP